MAPRPIDLTKLQQMVNDFESGKSDPVEFKNLLDEVAVTAAAVNDTIDQLEIDETALSGATTDVSTIQTALGTRGAESALPTGVWDSLEALLVRIVALETP